VVAGTDDKNRLQAEVVGIVCSYRSVYNVFRAIRSKPPPCPLLLTKQGGSIQCIVFISSQTCNMILHTYRYHQIYIVTLREDT
jgi:hypothetical protein